MGTKMLEVQNHSHRAFAESLSDKWRGVWEGLQERVRQQPTSHVLMTFAIGYVLQSIPFRRLLVLVVKLCLILLRPTLFLFCAFQLTKGINSGSASGEW